MMNSTRNTAMATTALVFFLMATLMPGGARAMTQSEIDDGQDMADLLMFGAMGVLAVALIIKIVEPAEESPEETETRDQEDDLASWRSDSLERDSSPSCGTETEAHPRPVKAMPVGGIYQGGAAVGISVGF